jgi:hypothetical protein
MQPQSMIRPSKFAKKFADLIGAVLMHYTCFQEISVLNLDQDSAILSFCDFSQSLHSISVSVYGLGHDRFLTQNLLFFFHHSVFIRRCIILS